MELEFDPGKDAVNYAKHGVSLGIARGLDWSTLISSPDSREDYGEQRMIGYGVVADRLYCLVYALRGDKCRVISLRKSNRREVKRYEKGK